MSQLFSEKQRKQWKRNILNQRESGLSAARWCRENNIKDHNFYHWRQKLFPKPTLGRSDFTEVADEKKCDGSGSKGTGITLECQGVHIYLDKQFDISTLKQCLAALKGVGC